MDHISALEGLALATCAVSILLNAVLPSERVRSGRLTWSDKISCAASVVLACLGFGLPMAGSS